MAKFCFGDSNKTESQLHVSSSSPVNGSNKEKGFTKKNFRGVFL